MRNRTNKKFFRQSCQPNILMSKTSPFKKEILVTISGLTPQVITETLKITPKNTFINVQLLSYIEGRYDQSILSFTIIPSPSSLISLDNPLKYNNIVLSNYQ